MAPMATTGQEAVGSMGTDTPVAVLSRKPKLLYNYFKQNFAQVTNPAIDPIREEAVMSLVSFIGPRPNLFDLKGASEKKRLEVRQPILTNQDLEKIRMIGDIADNHFQTQTLDITFAIERGGKGMEMAVDRLCERAERAVLEGYNIIILSDRLMGPGRVAIPALLCHRRGPQSPDPQGAQNLRRARGGDRRSARGASLLRPRRLRRGGDQPLSRLRDAA